MGSCLHNLVLTKVVALCHDKLHRCGPFVNEIILGKGSLYGGAWNTRSDTVHDHDTCIFSRLFDDGAIILPNHGTLDDCT